MASASMESLETRLENELGHLRDYGLAASDTRHHVQALGQVLVQLSRNRDHAAFKGAIQKLMAVPAISAVIAAPEESEEPHADHHQFVQRVQVARIAEHVLDAATLRAGLNMNLHASDPEIKHVKDFLKATQHLRFIDPREPIYL